MNTSVGVEQEPVEASESGYLAQVAHLFDFNWFDRQVH